MKNFVTTLVLCCAMFKISAQPTNVPQIINFQAVALDNQGNPLTDSTVLIRITARQGGPNGNAVYCGLHSLPTDAFGTFSFKMNQNPLGVNCNGASTAFLDIPWDLGIYYLSVEYSYNNGNTYTTIPSIEIASVPYAFLARKVERISTEGAVDGQVLKFNATANRFEPGPDNFQGGGNDEFTHQNSGLRTNGNRLSINGVANLCEGEASVTFPDNVKAYFQEKSGDYQYTVMLTPLSSDSKGLAVIEKNADGFKVKELQSATGNYAFDWEIKVIPTNISDPATQFVSPVSDMKH